MRFILFSFASVFTALAALIVISLVALGVLEGWAILISAAFLPLFTLLFFWAVLACLGWYWFESSRGIA